MSIPDAAIEAAIEGLKEWDILTAKGREDFACTAIEAAMPAIREAIAQEIESAVSTIWQREGNTDAAWCSGMDRAARIVRGCAA